MPGDLDTIAGSQGLVPLGHAAPEAGLPAGTGHLVLLGPDGGAFWAVFRASPEYGDGAPDPLDRWSSRVLGGIADRLGGVALLPFGGPPWHPFIAWALATGRCFPSPVGLLVHDRFGLMVSFRGAIALPGPPPPQPDGASPCESCTDKPCLVACPPRAMTGAGYDVAACHDFIDTTAGADCLSGCLVRRACPVGQGLRPEAQSAFHMAAFHRSRP
ncbi:ferredoxin [Oceanibium sediminis]|uniref:ferredoxin n=1 Tax=Oceanibium sediminis TaxID=2026339 RepID=UPI001E3C89DC|nr:ferredoxin [Oceanibium sediminis]